MAAMITIANANALHIPLPDRSVQCIVTSPPYYGLRDYGTAKWKGGSAECDHSPADTPTRRGLASSTLGGGKETTGHQQEVYSAVCSRCGARRIDAQIGLEATPAAYVANIVAVMRECWRVLKDDGVLWLNLGDSYASGEIGRHDSVQANNGNGWTGTRKMKERQQTKLNTGLKPKDLCGIPWRVAFALQDDGWYLRQDIIWNKPNPMPESVTDRCTKAHEYIFLLTKRARYFYDNEAIKENGTGRSSGNAEQVKGAGNDDPFFRTREGFLAVADKEWNFRNRRSVWTVAAQPYSGAHFATFPPALIEPMILAGSRRGDVVLDPFAGSGTTGAVSVKHGRRAVLLDLNTKYIDLQFERTNGIQMTLSV